MITATTAPKRATQIATLNQAKVLLLTCPGCRTAMERMSNE
jgi:Fe-S oxidoreductase